ncbi:hypothetical protein COU54_00310 [Candidatus Pacearchaeota archaeon CG10_big_fil_rev_8_21_14_0_10_31_24]|nr:MAG: hypothetical protein COU54_00310 [Candidatus Pacearchaeota archaeon CG10_big_fil_rev_8_21_14_0_10_31_24]
MEFVVFAGDVRTEEHVRRYACRLVNAHYHDKGISGVNVSEVGVDNEKGTYYKIRAEKKEDVVGASRWAFGTVEHRVSNI